jgi:hypothetical protein
LLVYVSGGLILVTSATSDPLPPEQAGGWQGMKRLIDTSRNLAINTFTISIETITDAPSYNEQFAVHEEDTKLPPQQFPSSRLGDLSAGQIP